MDVPIEVRQLRYFVAVAEELHFGRAAERVHMSQSPLSRAIRELERQLDVVLFVRTTRRVELTAAGAAFLEHARRALAEVDLAVERARAEDRRDRRVVAIGHGPLSRAAALGIAEELPPELVVRLEEDVTPDLLRRVGAGELAGAAVLETPGAAGRNRVRVDALKDEPLLAALPAAHRFAGERAIPLAAFVEECVLLPREPVGRAFTVWLRAVIRAAGFELRRTRDTLSAPWDRRMSLVAGGEVVSVVVGDWTESLDPGVVPVAFDPPLTFPIDLATAPTSEGAELARTALRLRDREEWLSSRRIESDGV